MESARRGCTCEERGEERVCETEGRPRGKDDWLSEVEGEGAGWEDVRYKLARSCFARLIASLSTGFTRSNFGIWLRLT